MLHHGDRDLSPSRADISMMDHQNSMRMGGISALFRFLARRYLISVVCKNFISHGFQSGGMMFVTLDGPNSMVDMPFNSKLNRDFNELSFFGFG
jgi:hypothetical protein